MKKALILSAGGTGRELFDLLSVQYGTINFLDDNKIDDELVVGSFSDVKKFESTHDLYTAFGSYKSMLFRRSFLENSTANWSSFISDKAMIYPSAHLEQSIIVFPNSVVSANTKIGIHAFIYHNCVLSHDSKIGKFSMLSNQVTVSGNVDIGENTYVGTGAVILEGRKIGKNSIIAAGAIVLDDVEDNSIYISKNNIKINHYNSL